MNSRSAVFFQNCCHSQDAYLQKRVDKSNFIDVVLDGVSSAQGGFASSFVKEKLAENSYTDLNQIIRDISMMSNQLNVVSRENSYTTLSFAMRYQDNSTEKLRILTCGDSPVYIWRKNGELAFSSDLDNLESDSNVLTGAIGYFHPKINSYDFELYAGDVLFIGTDGVTDNASPDWIYQFCISQSKTPKTAISRLERGLKLKQERSIGNGNIRFKKDDMTAIIRYFD